MTQEKAKSRISDYPTCTVGDLPQGSRIALPDSQETRALPIFRHSESGTAWQNDNAVGIQHIFPGNGIGLGIRPDLSDRARNQIRVMARWIDLNGCNSFYPAAVRVGYDPDEILRHLRHWGETSVPNGMRADNPHGAGDRSVQVIRNGKTAETVTGLRFTLKASTNETIELK